MPYTLSQILEGLDETIISQVENTVKENSTKLNAKVFIDGDGEHYVPAARLSEVTTERNDLRDTLNAQKEQIDNLSNITKDNEEAQKTISELNRQLENQSKLTKKAAITAKLASTVTDSVAPASDLLDFLNVEEITVKEDGTIIGLDEQLTKVRENRKYLFKEADSTEETKRKAGTGNPGNEINPAAAGAHDPKKVGMLGKQLAEQVSKNNQPSESNFWK